MNIRPEVQALINRGRVQFDELVPLDCNRLEATALIPALTDVAVAMRIERTTAHLPRWHSRTPQYAVKSWMPEVCRRLQSEPAELPNMSNQEIASNLTSALQDYPKPEDPCIANSYVDALFFLATNAAERLEGGL